MTRETSLRWLADGRMIAFDTAGPEDGVPVFFYHGLFTCRLIPAPAAAAATRHGIRLISLDRPGVGLSDFQPDRTLLDWPKDVAEVADLLEIERFRVFGASGGSGYVLASCFEIPERIVRGAIASGLTPFAQTGVVHRIVPGPIDPLVKRSLRASRAAHRLIVEGMRRSPERAVEALKGTVPACDQPVLERPEISGYLIDSALESARFGVRGMAYDDWLVNQPWGFAPADVPQSVPVDVWAGSEDTDVPLALSQRLASEVRGATLRVQQGTGHFGTIFDHLDEIFSQLAADEQPESH